MTPSLRRRLLIHLADEGAVEDPAGHVTSLLAAALGCTPSHIGTVLARLDEQGMVLRDHNPISGRTFRALLTDAGRAEVNRGTHVRTLIRRRPEPTPVVMPVLGPISRVPFDPEMARERALGGVA